MGSLSKGQRGKKKEMLCFGFDFHLFSKDLQQSLKFQPTPVAGLVARTRCMYRSWFSTSDVVTFILLMFLRVMGTFGIHSSLLLHFGLGCSIQM